MRRPDVRLFIAIELDEAVRRELARVQETLKPACRGVRWVKPELLHLTIKFLGEVPDGDVTGVTTAVETAAGASGGFDMDVGGSCGCFPPRGLVRVVWSSVTAEEGVLSRCVEHVERALEQAGFPRERKPFRPHITLGRVRYDDSRGAIRAAVEACTARTIGQRVDRLTVMSSVLSRGGPTYTPVARFDLGG
ncbi:MAG: RNA 2',3'-cyclic phosphodiesterase [Planctomycetota bacterium]|nr:MAG: RNA 2',3'-cyclic phosphodiesterase [Planctomycetota bacterium]